MTAASPEDLGIGIGIDRDPNILPDRVRDAHQALFCAFVWENTTQGFKYWDTVHRHLLEFEKQGRDQAQAQAQENSNGE